MALITVENYRSFMKNMSPEQKKILTKYFCSSGCLGALTAMKDNQYDALSDIRIKFF